MKSGAKGMLKFIFSLMLIFTVSVFAADVKPKYGPKDYWVSIDTFLAGMATKDKSSNLNRGYIWIKTGN
jgi:hypothetical protein